jgi:hypothetical protein
MLFQPCGNPSAANTRGHALHTHPKALCTRRAAALLLSSALWGCSAFG